MAGGFIKSIIRGAISGSSSSGKGKSKFDANSRPQPELFDEEKAAIKKKKLEIRELRRETSRLASKANKRIARLESNNLKSTPKRFVLRFVKRFVSVRLKAGMVLVLSKCMPSLVRK